MDEKQNTGSKDSISDYEFSTFVELFSQRIVKNGVFGGIVIARPPSYDGAYYEVMAEVGVLYIFQRAETSITVIGVMESMSGVAEFTGEQIFTRRSMIKQIDYFIDTANAMLEDDAWDVFRKVHIQNVTLSEVHPEITL